MAAIIASAMGIPPVPAQPRFKRITRSETYLIIYLRLRYETTVIYYPDPSILSPFDFFNPSSSFPPIYYVFRTRCILYVRSIQLVHSRSRSIGLVSSRHDTSWSRVSGNGYVRAETRESRGASYRGTTRMKSSLQPGIRYNDARWRIQRWHRPFFSAYFDPLYHLPSLAFVPLFYLLSGSHLRSSCPSLFVPLPC